MTPRSKSGTAALGEDGLPLAPWGHILRRLAGLVWPHRRAGILGLLLSLASAGTALLFPAMVGEATALASGTRSSLVPLILLGACSLTVKPLLEAAQDRMTYGFGLAVYQELTSSLMEKVLALEPEAVETAGASKFTSRAVNDTREVNDLVANGLPALILLGSTVLTSLVYLFRLDPRLLIPLAGAALVLSVGTAFFLPVSRRNYERSLDATARVTGTLTQLATSGVRLEQAGWLQEARQDSLEAIEHRYAVRRRGVTLRSRAFLVEGLAAATLVVGPILVAVLAQGSGRDISVDHVASAVALGVTLGNGLSEVAFWADSIQLSGLAFGRIFGLDFVSRSSGAPSVSAECASAAAVKCDRVGFTYPGAETPTLRDVTLTVRRGEHAALIGLSGGGKTTLIRLLAGQLRAGAGQATVAGVEPTVARSAVGESGRPLLLYACQEPFYFTGSVVENILMGQDRGDERCRDEVDAVLRTPGLGSLESLALTEPMSRDELSAAQLRDISLARLLWRRPEIILFDEAFAGKGLEEQRALLAALPEGTTTLSVVHDRRILPAFDRVLLLEEGRLTELADLTDSIGPSTLEAVD